eukprot:2136087-Pyramimonas_sp.AAC.1
MACGRSDSHNTDAACTVHTVESACMEQRPICCTLLSIFPIYRVRTLKACHGSVLSWVRIVTGPLNIQNNLSGKDKIKETSEAPLQNMDVG